MDTDQNTIDERRAKVSDLYCRGCRQWEIAAQLGVSADTIAGDLKHIRETWKAAGVRDMTATREAELAKLDTIEREAWNAWENEHDPRFLEKVLQCIKRRAELLGLDAPTKQQIFGDTDQPLVVQVIETVVHSREEV